MVTQLIEHERIRTTLPKAKELRRVAEKVVTMAKQRDEPGRKRAQSIVRTPEAMAKLFDVVGPRYAYVRVYSFACVYTSTCILACG